MDFVRPKKHLGQHFLKGENIAEKIVSSLSGKTKNVLEIGPGMGVLTKYLLKDESILLHAIEIDRDSVAYLTVNFPELRGRIIEGDFLHIKFDTIIENENFSIIGNFPYNISSQILFKVLEHRNRIPEVVGMFQKEVAQRIAEPPGSKAYGIISVLLQAYYDIEYLFTVNENVFSPPPKVKSAVIRLTRNNVQKLDCDEKLFKSIVKTAFNQRRKTLRNALKTFHFNPEMINNEMLNRRAETLSIAEFIEITNWVIVEN